VAGDARHLGVVEGADAQLVIGPDKPECRADARKIGAPRPRSKHEADDQGLARPRQEGKAHPDQCLKRSLAMPSKQRAHITLVQFAPSLPSLLSLMPAFPTGTQMEGKLLMNDNYLTGSWSKYSAYRSKNPSVQSSQYPVSTEWHARCVNPCDRCSEFNQNRYLLARPLASQNGISYCRSAASQSDVEPTSWIQYPPPLPVFRYFDETQRRKSGCPLSRISLQEIFQVSRACLEDSR